jgi:hypothetical protein
LGPLAWRCCPPRIYSHIFSPAFNSGNDDNARLLQEHTATTPYTRNGGSEDVEDNDNNASAAALNTQATTTSGCRNSSRDATSGIAGDEPDGAPPFFQLFLFLFSSYSFKDATTAPGSHNHGSTTTTRRPGKCGDSEGDDDEGPCKRSGWRRGRRCASLFSKFFFFFFFFFIFFVLIQGCDDSARLSQQ